ncbi:DoxX family membrane protein [Deinococcus saxicola]|uniref:DoxX family protein n=1 Tax=Deinococcus saxicola TaxID=249406 RepID=UPI0039EF0475
MPFPVSSLQTAARVLLGAALAFAGTGHLTFLRQDFQAQVPKSLPLNQDLVVLASGVVEIGMGVALMALSRQRVAVGWIVAAFFVAVFPGNISQYLTHSDAFGLDTDRKRLIRLFFQPVLIAWALWSSGAWAARKKG